MPEKALLIILDGFGLRDDAHGNAIKGAAAPTLAKFSAHLSRTFLETSGEAVGLPPGQMGNSEVGHMNMGAGRVVYQTLTRIDKAIEDGSFFDNPVLRGAAEAAKSGSGRLHLMGLVSDGGVHSHQAHLHALLELARREGLAEVFVHAFTDGRDTGPRTGVGFLRGLEEAIREAGVGAIASVSGRYYAMDRDARWDRTKLAYDAVVRGEGPVAPGAAAWLEKSYADDVTDEFIVPAVVQGVDGRVRDGDAVLFFNFRPDRARQLTRALGEGGFGEFDVSGRPEAHLATMTRYEKHYPYPVAFEKQDLEATCGEVVARAGLRQLRIAETEKYAHVTYFFSGGREDPFDGEERILVPSPKVATYDLQPEMSAQEVTDRVVPRLEAGGHDLVVLNFANCDMVGHTGDYDATVRAVEAVDACLARILEAAAPHYHVFITADHGNAEEMVDAAGGPQTAHTTLPVPLYYVGPRARKMRPGILADVAPTILEAMGLEAPEAMTGGSLFMD